MLELGAGVPLSKQICNLLHFEGTFERDWKVELATEEKQSGNIGIFFSDLLDLIAQFQNRLDLRGQRFQCLNDPAPFGGGKGAHTSEEEANERKYDNLRRERFRRCDADLRASMHVNASVVLPRDCARNVVADSKSSEAFTSAFAERAERVRGFAALADSENQRLAGQRRVPMTELTRVFDF